MKTFPRIFHVLLASLLAACTTAPLGALGETESAITGAQDEAELHRADVAAASTVAEVRAERARHNTTAGALYAELRARAMGGDCPDSRARATLVVMLNGIAATELGLDQALDASSTVEAMREDAAVYLDGITDLLDGVAATWSSGRCAAAH